MSGLPRIIGVVVGLLLVVACGGVALVTFIANPSMSDNGQLGGTIFLVGLTVLGFWMLRRWSPAFFGRFVGSPSGLVRWLLQPSAVWHPVRLAVWTLLIGLVLLAPAPRHGARAVVALGGFLLYVLLAMIGLAIRPRWWVRALQTLLLEPVVMSGLMFTAEAFEKNVIGEGSLAFAGVLMWSWAIIPVTGFGRLIFARPTPASPPPTASGPADRPA
jgi:hypothetical protein